MSTYWILALKQAYKIDKYLTYDSKLTEPNYWFVSSFTCRAKTWKNKETAQKWADKGNELINRFDIAPVRWEPVEAESINYIMVPKNGTNR